MGLWLLRLKKAVCGGRGRIPSRWRRRRNPEVVRSRRGERGSAGLVLTFCCSGRSSVVLFDCDVLQFRSGSIFAPYLDLGRYTCNPSRLSDVFLDSVFNH